MSLYGLKLHLRRHGQRAHVAHPVTSSYDLFIKLWNVDNAYHNFATLRGHDHSVSSARFLPGDTHILSSSRDAHLVTPTRGYHVKESRWCRAL